MIQQSNSRTSGKVSTMHRGGGLGRRLAFFAFMAALGVLARPVCALQVTPSIHFLELKGGEKGGGTYTVFNDATEPVVVIPELKEWYIYPENEKKGITIDKWLKVKASTFTLKPGESKKINFDVRAPKEAIGELMGMVSFLMEGGDKFIKKRFSLGVYVGIKGTEKPAGEIMAVMVDVSSANLVGGFFFNNKGNVHMRPEGMMFITDEKGQPVANIAIKQTTPAFPGERKAYTGTIPKHTLPPGNYSVKIVAEDVDRGVPIPETVKKFTVTKDKKVKTQ